MAKFSKSIDEDEMAPPVERVAPKAIMAELAKIAPEPVPVVQAAVQPQPTPVAPPPPPPVTPTPTPAATPAPQPEFNFQVAEPSADKKEESWVKSLWRPAMGWLYMLICLMDFVVFPAIAMFMPVMLKGIGITMNYVAWQSLTLSNGGLIHMAFGAILGVAAYGRTQEKVASKQ
jgi:Holin of 3TMs, for gene-transfer release